MLKDILRTGVVAALVKLIGAALAYITFVAIARVTSVRDFGIFGTVFSAASLLSFFLTFGQQSVVLRFWPQSEAVGSRELANGYLSRSARVVALGTIISLGTMLAWAAFADRDGQYLGPSLLATGWILLASLTWAEFLSAALRARSSVYLSLIPRDIAWRVAVIIGACILRAAAIKISAVKAVAGVGALLLFCLLPQALSIWLKARGEGARRLSSTEACEFNRVSLGLWGVTSLPPAVGQASVLLVAALLGPEIAGGVFAAERTARLVVLGLNGLNQVLAPELSAAYYRGKIDSVRSISAATALASTFFALVAVAAFATFGVHILGAFNGSYKTTELTATLVIFGVGQLVASAAGPTGLILQLTGRQQKFLKILVGTNALGLGAIFVGARLFGPVGAAVAISSTLALWNMLAVRESQAHLRVDPSIFGTFRRDGLVSQWFRRRAGST